MNVDLRQVPALVILAGCAVLLALLPARSSGARLQISAEPLVAAAIPEHEHITAKAIASPIGRPVRLTIPRIKVDAAVEDVGLTSDGAMDVTNNPDGVAWYESGQRPGDTGSAVMAGHYGWTKGRGAVFDNLHMLRAGDAVRVEDEQGVVTSFVVRGSRRYDPQADAVAVFGSNDGESHLNLITCGGKWNMATGSYSNRLVVFTDKE